MAHFVESILNDAPHIATGEEGLRVVKILDAIYASAAQGQPVRIWRATEVAASMAKPVCADQSSADAGRLRDGCSGFRLPANWRHARCTHSCAS